MISALLTFLFRKEFHWISQSSPTGGTWTVRHKNGRAENHETIKWNKSSARNVAANHPRVWRHASRCDPLSAGRAVRFTAAAAASAGDGHRPPGATVTSSSSSSSLFSPDSPLLTCRFFVSPFSSQGQREQKNLWPANVAASNFTFFNFFWEKIIWGFNDFLKI